MMLWTHQLAPLPVVVPLTVAALLAAFGNHLPRRLTDTLALLTTAAVAAACGLLARAAAHGTVVYWFGDWHPDAHAFPVGICFVIDPMGAGLAALVATLATASFAFGWAYFDEVKSLYHALMLAFVAAMCGLCLTGDLFNLFVWFELMTAVAVALCGYKSEESGPLLGALNFAVVNTIGAFLSLAGVAVLYAWTGSLNMAAVGRGLAAHPPGTTFVAVAFVLVIAGFVVKMAAVPFQLWLADAHAVAPTPVCVLFSGVMVELGLYAVARLYWTVFAPVLPAAPVRDVFLVMGAVTAVVGAIYCFGQRHLKRMLAFSTISHLGLMLIGFALLDRGGLGGLATYLVGHGMIKGALFLGAGILLHRCGSVDEHDLRGGGGNLKLLGVILFVGALGLVGMPPFATFYGESQMHEAAERLHLGWLTYVAVPVEALTAGAVLRFTARVFLGWGRVREATSRGAAHIPMDTETAGAHDHTPWTMWLPAVVLLAAAAVVAVPGPFRSAAAAAAGHFQQSHLLTAVTLDGAVDQSPAFPPPPAADFRAENVVTLAAAFGVALLAVFPGVLGRRLNWRLGRALVAAMRPLRRLQSGSVGDYVAWFAFGIAAYGGLLLLFLRR